MAGSNPRAAARYTPGSWIGVVRAGTVVLLSPGTAPSLVETLWALLAGRPEVHEVLAAVTAASGGSLARLPEFGIVHVGESLQVFLRGGIDLETHGLPGEQHPGRAAGLSGRDVTTWTERRLAKPESFRLVIAGAAPAAGEVSAEGAGAGHDELPLSEGVVFLQGLSVDVGGAVVASTGAAAAAVPAPKYRGVSAETVLELPADDADATAAAPAAEPAPEPTPEPAPDRTQEPGPEPAPEAAGRELSAPESTSNYDHLWEQTVMRSIEDAAVREDPDDADLHDVLVAGAAHPAHAAQPEPVLPQQDQPEPGPAGGMPVAAEPPATVEQPAASASPVLAGIIDSVPWPVAGRTEVRPPSFQPGSAQPAERATEQSTGQPAEQRAEQASGKDVKRDAGHGLGHDADHDGQTIVKDQAAPGAPARQGAVPARTSAPGTGPMVLARVCAGGHANPSTYAQCGRCGLPLPGDGVQVRRPLLGRMRLSSGELIALDQSLVVGRQPSVSRVQGAVMPRLVQVPSPSGDISRSHVEVRLEGWHVMLCDLKATNGTVLVREGQAPRRLAQGEMAILLDGDIAELGDGISLRFEEIP